jgi:presequence protease
MRGLKNLFIKKTWIAWFLCISFMAMLSPTLVQASENAALTVGQIYNGFKLIEDKPVADINSKARIFEHIKSGAHVLYLENDDENKVFSINFYTPPSNDTGVNHIIEHSVLYGSEKYPVKSPLMEVFKTSVSNMANAFTSNDRTSYPFATNNYKDFKNVMGIYMDAVFFPNFRKDSRIFEQEGWHYELDSKEGELKYNGVVYNEMKGLYSSPDFALTTNVKKSLYPDTLYNWEAGGNPALIPTLTYEKTLETYNKNYHPSNSYIYLYGNLHIMDTLKFLDEDYLSKFDKKTYNKVVPKQTPFTERKIMTAEYALPKNSDTKNKTYLALNYAIDLKDNYDDLIGLQLLSSILLNSDMSPFKMGLLQKGFGSSVSGTLDITVSQPTFQIIVTGSEESKKDDFLKFMDSTLVSLVKNGLDKNFIHSIFNAVEIQLRNEKTQGLRGLNYNEAAMIGWLYSGDPIKYLKTEESIANIKKSIDNGYFEKLIQKYLIDNKHSSLVVLKPKAGLEEELSEKTSKTLSEYKLKLSAEQLDALVKYTKEFKVWQNTPDSKEALATIPTLALSDLTENESSTYSIVKDLDGATVINHPIYTNKLVYMNMYFDSTTVPQDKLPYLYLLSTLLGRLDTESYSFQEIYSKMLNVGGIGFGPTAIPKFMDNDIYYPKFMVTASTLAEKFEEATVLAEEIMNKTKFDNKEDIRKYVKEMRANLESYLTYMPNLISETKIQAYISPLGKYNDIGYLDFYNFIKELDGDFDSKADEAIKNLKEVSKLLFNKENLIVSLTVDESEYNKAEKDLAKLLQCLNNEKLQKYSYNFDSSVKNEAFVLPSNVQYTAKGANINKLGFKYNGSMTVLEKILSMEYLMPEVREKGGAYGAGFSISTEGNAIFTSYRDPNLSESLNAFDKASDFLRNFKADDKQMTSYILGIISPKDNLFSPSQKAAMLDMDYISGRTAEASRKIKEEILSTTAKDISAYASLIDALARENTYTVAGNASKIGANKELFSDIIDVFNNKPAKPSELTLDQVKELVKTAKSSKLFADYNKAYSELLKLSAENQQSLSADLAAEAKEAFTADIIKALTALKYFYDTPNLKTFTEVAAFIQTGVQNEKNREYLLMELQKWGYSLVFTPDVEEAINAINLIAQKPEAAAIKAAEVAIAKVKNEENRKYLDDQFNQLKALLKIN